MTLLELDNILKNLESSLNKKFRLNLYSDGSGSLFQEDTKSVVAQWDDINNLTLELSELDQLDKLYGF